MRSEDLLLQAIPGEHRDVIHEAGTDEAVVEPAVTVDPRS